MASVFRLDGARQLSVPALLARYRIDELAVEDAGAFKDLERRHELEHEAVELDEYAWKALAGNGPDRWIPLLGR